MKLFAVNLKGGGADLACRECLPEARRDRKDVLVSVAAVSAPGEMCSWCGVEGE